MTKPTRSLVRGFQDRLVADLARNNVLRGLWAEEIVASLLEDWEFSDPWVYYDLRSKNGKTLSIKQSAGLNPKFSLLGQDAAVIPAAERSANDDDGWRYPSSGIREYLCNVYVFAWLPGDLVSERVLNPDE